MKMPPRHRNVTAKRLFLDAYQFVRAQSFVSRRFGRQFLPSRDRVEIDITYKCNVGLLYVHMCAVAGGIDRIFQYGLGRKELPEESDDFSDQMLSFCRLCGHFGFQWPTRRTKISKTWLSAYNRWRAQGEVDQDQGTSN